MVAEPAEQDGRVDDVGEDDRHRAVGGERARDVGLLALDRLLELLEADRQRLARGSRHSISGTDQCAWTILHSPRSRWRTTVPRASYAHRLGSARSPSRLAHPTVPSSQASISFQRERERHPAHLLDLAPPDGAILALPPFCRIAADHEHTGLLRHPSRRRRRRRRPLFATIHRCTTRRISSDGSMRRDNTAVIAAVILAAGEASRFGSPKQQLMLAGILERVRASSVDEIVVVEGAYELETDARVVRCPEWARRAGRLAPLRPRRAGRRGGGGDRRPRRRPRPRSCRHRPCHRRLARRRGATSSPRPTAASAAIRCCSRERCGQTCRTRVRVRSSPCSSRATTSAPRGTSTTRTISGVLSSPERDELRLQLGRHLLAAGGLHERRGARSRTCSGRCNSYTPRDATRPRSARPPSERGRDTAA